MRNLDLLFFISVFCVALFSSCAEMDLLQEETALDTEEILTAIPEETAADMFPDETTNIEIDDLVISGNNLNRLSIFSQASLPGAIKAGWNEPKKIINVMTVQQSYKLHYPDLSTISTTSWQEDSMIYDLAGDGSLIALSYDMQTIEIFDVGTGQTINKIIPDTMVNSASFSPDNTNLLVTSMDESIAIEYSVSSGEIQNTFRGFEFAGPVYDAFYACQTNDIIWYSRGSVQVQNRQTQEMSPFFSHEDFANSIALSPDGTILAVSTAMTVDDDFSPGIQLWDRNTGDSIGFIQTNDLVKDLVFTTDKTAILGAEGLFVKAWNPKTLNEIVSLKGHNDTISFLSLSPDGKHVMTGSFDNSIILWNLNP